MKIAINKIEVETVEWSSLAAGSLFTDPDLDDSPLYIKTDEFDSIDLLTGSVESQFLPDYEVVDATDKYVIVDI
tara:strand:- start:383 stop:604 length:222 start_codon:yes stop_codon:yes gene_type:complete